MRKYFGVICIMMFVFTAYGQTELSAKDSIKLTKLESKITRAELSLSKANKELEEADSLLHVGKIMVDEGKVEDKALEANGKTMDKEYAESRKPFEKSLKSKDKVEVGKAKAEIKKLDSQYKGDIKLFLSEKKAIIKKINTGKLNLAKGKVYKKNAHVDIKQATKALNDAQKTYDNTKSMMLE